MFFHESFGKILGAFELCCFFCWSENIHDTSRQRHFRSDDSQAYMFLLNKVSQRRWICDVDVFQTDITRGSTVTWCDKNRLYAFRLSEFPGECMFTATRADNENFHIILQRWRLYRFPGR